MSVRNSRIKKGGLILSESSKLRSKNKKLEERIEELEKQLSIHVVSFSKPTYKDKNQLPDDIKYLFHKGVDLYQTIMDYERGIIGPEEFIAEMRKVDKAY